MGELPSHPFSLKQVLRSDRETTLDVVHDIIRDLVTVCFKEFSHHRW